VKAGGRRPAASQSRRRTTGQQPAAEAKVETVERARGFQGAELRRGALRELGRLVLESVLAGTFVSLVLALAVFIVATQAQAQATPSRADVQQGTLLLRDDGGVKAAAPLLFTEVHIDVSGLTARTEVKQRFVNPTSEWREGVYLFPLPEKAAVDHLDMRIGGRVIEGQIKEKQAARAAYEQAKTDGRKATLVEQERPNLFTTRVAHIGPDEEIVVAIQYQEKLVYDAGSFRLRFPMAITPRYTPSAAGADGDKLAEAGMSSGAGASDASSITPKIADPAEGAINPLSLSVDIDAGFPLARVSSTYHPVRVEERPGNRYHLTLANGVVPAARDFELVYTPDVGAEPGAALFTEIVDGKTYGLLMVLPPTTKDVTTARPPREVTYIIDTSGSMEGVSITQARDAMLLALDRLREGDRFNVIEFNSVTRTLYGAPMPVSAATLAQARDFVNGLRARGGTEMKPALEAAFAAPKQDALMRQIVFMTDGAVGNEDELLALIARKLGDRRLFTVGIGPAPNTWFMKKAAEAGRGTFTFIGDVREVREKMSALIRKLESPVLTDVHVDWPVAVESYPPQLPDLYAGEPVILTAAFAKGNPEGTVKLSGRGGAATWKAAMPLVPGASEPGIGVLFARDKIEALHDARRNGANEDDVKRETIAIALTHHLVSAYTSLVAVDVTPTAPAGVVAQKSVLPGNLPEGLAYDAFYGGLPQTATPAAAQLLAGVLLMLAASGVWLATRRRTGATAKAAHRGDPMQLLDALTRAARRVC
jgi:Ca-activated chloride channel family protein